MLYNIAISAIVQYYMVCMKIYNGNKNIITNIIKIKYKNGNKNIKLDGKKTSADSFIWDMKELKADLVRRDEILLIPKDRTTRFESCVV